MALGCLLALFWRAWKYLLHLVTGKCELERICERYSPLYVRSAAIAACLRSSRDPDLRRVGTEGGMRVDDAIKIITHAKKLPGSDSPSSSCITRLRYSLVQITSLNTLRNEVIDLRAVKYCQEDSEHEDKLMEVWSSLCPDVPLEARLTNQWSDIGFQGNNPATDFRGMGLLGLHCLQYFSSKHTSLARSVLSSSQHPVIGYPFAIVGINLTSLLYQWLHDDTSDHHYYYWITDRPITLSDFMESYCYTFRQFNTHWVDAKPDNVMAFPAVRDKFAAILKEQLTRTPPTLMKIVSNE